MIQTHILKTDYIPGQYKVYPYLIGNRNQMNVILCGRSGMTLANNSNSDYKFLPDVYKTIPSDSDYITIKFGINDKYKNTPLGTINDTVDTSFYGAWNILLKYLITNFPKSKIGVIVSNDINDINYVNATIECAEKWRGWLFKFSK